jgi:hypothetical protein
MQTPPFSEAPCGGYDRVVVVDELPIVAWQVEEAAHHAHRTGLRLVMDGLDLGMILGDTYGGDDVAKVAT